MATHRLPARLHGFSDPGRGSRRVLRSAAHAHRNRRRNHSCDSRDGALAASSEHHCCGGVAARRTPAARCGAGRAIPGSERSDKELVSRAQLGVRAGAFGHGNLARQRSDAAAREYPRAHFRLALCAPRCVRTVAHLGRVVAARRARPPHRASGRRAGGAGRSLLRGDFPTRGASQPRTHRPCAPGSQDSRCHGLVLPVELRVLSGDVLVFISTFAKSDT